MNSLKTKKSQQETWNYNSEAVSLELNFKESRVASVNISKRKFNSIEVNTYLLVNQQNDACIWREYKKRYDEIIYVTDSKDRRRAFWRPLEGVLTISVADNK